MITVMKWGAMYGQLEAGDTIDVSPIQLGDELIQPGDRIARIGAKKRAMFSMSDGFALQYAGRVDKHILFKSHPTGVDGNPWYYAFAYADPYTLVVGSAKGCSDIRVDELVREGELA